MQLYEFRFCEGTTGFIQTNTGVADNNPYSPDDFPGVGDRERISGGREDNLDNTVHPFIVITEYTC